MCAKITVSDPVVVAQGPTVEEAGWGPFQFPFIRRTGDGSFLVNIHLGPDSLSEYGKDDLYYQSDDGGETWQKVSAKTAAPLSGTWCKDGSCLKILGHLSLPVENLELPTPLDWASTGIPIEGNIFYTLRHYYDLDQMGHIMKKKWDIQRRSPTGEVVITEARLDFPGMTTWEELNTGLLAFPDPQVRMYEAPDGSLWVPHYECCKNPETGGMSPYCDTYFLRSNDHGQSFQLVSWIQYQPNTKADPDAFWREGFDEGTMAWLPDGSIITLLRTDMEGPSYLVRSADGGLTWSEPKVFDKMGVMPCLCRLDCGVTLASYGRPGVFVRATSDPSGLEWDAPIEIISTKNRYLEINNPELIDPSVYRYKMQDQFARTCRRGTCSYTGICPIDERSALFVYSDFMYPAPDGKKRKSILCRKITVENL